MITNELSLPEPLVSAVHNDSYDRGDCDYSTTMLIAPARIVQLRKEHRGQITEDVSDRIFTLMGQAIHSVLERAASDRYLIEQRYFHTHDGARVSGQIDLYDKETKTLQDWKITSRFTTKEGAKEEWIAQGNINRYLMWKNGIEVKAIQYVAIFRDWSKMAVSRGVKDYPPRQVQVLDLPKWSKEEVESYLSERIAVHRAAETELPMCSPEERWSKPAKFALMRKGRKRATKLYDSHDEAQAASDGQPDLYVEGRKGEETRCVHYCPVSAYCDFGRQAILEAAGEA